MTIDRRHFLKGLAGAAAAGVAGLPPASTLGATPIVEAAAPSIAPAVQFFRYGLSLDGGPAIFATFERLPGGVIRVAENQFGPGETLSFWANGLGSVFDISSPAPDDYVDVREEPEDEGEDDWPEVFEEPHYRPAFFHVAPGDPHYGAVLAAMGEAVEVERRRVRSNSIDDGDDANDESGDD